MDRREFIRKTVALTAVAATPALALVGPKVEYIIGPSIMWAERSTVTVRDNARTIFYELMERWTIVDGKIKSVEVTKVASSEYWQWLRDDPTPRNHYPHIQFGGAVVAGKSDPQFYNRWLAYARWMM